MPARRESLRGFERSLLTVYEGICCNYRPQRFRQITLAKHFNALLQPASGEVLIKGMNTKDEDKLWNATADCRHGVPNPDNQLVATIVEEDVAFGGKSGPPPEKIRQRVDQALLAVNMSEACQIGPHYLSGGQKQRIAIAGVIAMRPEIIILDSLPPCWILPEERK